MNNSNNKKHERLKNIDESNQLLNNHNWNNNNNKKKKKKIDNIDLNHYIHHNHENCQLSSSIISSYFPSDNLTMPNIDNDQAISCSSFSTTSDHNNHIIMNKNYNDNNANNNEVVIIDNDNKKNIFSTINNNSHNNIHEEKNSNSNQELLSSSSSLLLVGTTTSMIMTSLSSISDHFSITNNCSDTNKGGIVNVDDDTVKKISTSFSTTIMKNQENNNNNDNHCSSFERPSLLLHSSSSMAAVVVTQMIDNNDADNHDVDHIDDCYFFEISNGDDVLNDNYDNDKVVSNTSTLNPHVNNMSSSSSSSSFIMDVHSDYENHTKSSSLMTIHNQEEENTTNDNESLILQEQHQQSSSMMVIADARMIVVGDNDTSDDDVHHKNNHQENSTNDNSNFEQHQQPSLLLSSSSSSMANVITQMIDVENHCAGNNDADHHDDDCYYFEISNGDDVLNDNNVSTCNTSFILNNNISHVVNTTSSFIIDAVIHSDDNNKKSSNTSSLNEEEVETANDNNDNGSLLQEHHQHCCTNNMVVVNDSSLLLSSSMDNNDNNKNLNNDNDNESPFVMNHQEKQNYVHALKVVDDESTSTSSDVISKELHDNPSSIIICHEENDDNNTLQQNDIFDDPSSSLMDNNDDDDIKHHSHDNTMMIIPSDIISKVWDVNECSSSSNSDHAVVDSTIDLMDVESSLSSASLSKNGGDVCNDDGRHSHSASAMVASSHWCSSTSSSDDIILSNGDESFLSTCHQEKNDNDLKQQHCDERVVESSLPISLYSRDNNTIISSTSCSSSISDVVIISKVVDESTSIMNHQENNINDLQEHSNEVLGSSSLSSLMNYAVHDEVANKNHSPSNTVITSSDISKVDDDNEPSSLNDHDENNIDLQHNNIFGAWISSMDNTVHDDTIHDHNNNTITPSSDSIDVFSNVNASSSTDLRQEKNELQNQCNVVVEALSLSTDDDIHDDDTKDYHGNMMITSSEISTVNDEFCSSTSDSQENNIDLQQSVVDLLSSVGDDVHDHDVHFSHEHTMITSPSDCSCNELPIVDNKSYSLNHQENDDMKHGKMVLESFLSRDDDHEDDLHSQDNTILLISDILKVDEESTSSSDDKENIDSQHHMLVVDSSSDISKVHDEASSSNGHEDVHSHFNVVGDSLVDNVNEYEMHSHNNTIITASSDRSDIILNADESSSLDDKIRGTNQEIHDDKSSQDHEDQLQTSCENTITMSSILTTQLGKNTRNRNKQRPKVFCLGVSYPDLQEQIKKDVGTLEQLSEQKKSNKRTMVCGEDENDTFDKNIRWYLSDMNLNMATVTKIIYDCVKRKIITEMDGRDMMRCYVTERCCSVDVYTASQENGCIYRNDRHIDGNFNRTLSFVKSIEKQFGYNIQFEQIILDYFWIPNGWNEQHWSRTFLEKTLIAFVEHNVLKVKGKKIINNVSKHHIDYDDINQTAPAPAEESHVTNDNNGLLIKSKRKRRPPKRILSVKPKKASSSRCSVKSIVQDDADCHHNQDDDNDEANGMIYLPFCFYCFKEIISCFSKTKTKTKKLSQYFNIKFIYKDQLDKISLWYGTQQINPSKMQTILGKQSNQEDVYCTFGLNDVKSSYTNSNDASYTELIAILKRLENFPDIRFIALQPIPHDTENNNNHQNFGRILGLVDASTQVQNGIPLSASTFDKKDPTAEVPTKSVPNSNAMQSAARAKRVRARRSVDRNVQQPPVKKLRITATMKKKHLNDSAIQQTQQHQGEQLTQKQEQAIAEQEISSDILHNNAQNYNSNDITVPRTVRIRRNRSKHQSRENQNTDNEIDVASKRQRVTRSQSRTSPLNHHEIVNTSTKSVTSKVTSKNVTTNVSDHVDGNVQQLNLRHDISLEVIDSNQASRSTYHSDASIIPIITDGGLTIDADTSITPIITDGDLAIDAETYEPCTLAICTSNLENASDTKEDAVEVQALVKYQHKNDILDNQVPSENSKDILALSNVLTAQNILMLLMLLNQQCKNSQPGIDLLNNGQLLTRLINETACEVSINPFVPEINSTQTGICTNHSDTSITPIITDCAGESNTDKENNESCMLSLSVSNSEEASNSIEDNVVVPKLEKYSQRELITNVLQKYEKQTAKRKQN